MRKYSKIIAVTTAVAAMAASLAGCSSGGGADDNAHITLTVQTFGQFGYEHLYKRYEKLHPYITVKATTVASAQDQDDFINTHLAANNGMPDVVAVEGGYLAEQMQYPKKWLPVDDSLKNRWFSWKKAPAIDSDGVMRFYGVDAGPTAVCYDSDLIKAAGFPSDPAGFAKWIGNTWDSYYAAGEQYAAKTGKKWFDSANDIIGIKLVQIKNAFEDNDNNVIATTNSQVKDAFESALKDHEKLSAALTPFSPDWNAGVQGHKFATLMCPSWEIGLLKAAAPNVTGWNIADTLPGGGANRGGSYLGVSTQTKHPEQAKALAAWLTAPAQGIAAFQAVGSFPSQRSALSSEKLLNSTSAWASDAPTGKIYASRAKAITTAPYRGPSYGAILTYLQKAVTRVETGQMSVDESWDKFVSDVKQNVKSPE